MNFQTHTIRAAQLAAFMPFQTARQVAIDELGGFTARIASTGEVVEVSKVIGDGYVVRNRNVPGERRVQASEVVL